MRPILLIMWTAFQSFILRDNNNNNNIGLAGFCFCSYLFAPSPRSESLEQANIGESISRGSRGVLVHPPLPSFVRKIPSLRFQERQQIDKPNFKFFAEIYRLNSHVVENLFEEKIHPAVLVSLQPVRRPSLFNLPRT